MVCTRLNNISLFSRYRSWVYMYVDYPGSMSLTQIYATFNRAMLRVVPNLRVYSDTLTNAMVTGEGRGEGGGKGIEREEKWEEKFI